MMIRFIAVIQAPDVRKFNVNIQEIDREDKVAGV